uniref:Uncharacterized protein n=1 Tax=Anguilla anguilla TaxID=7936 RepID=A0A0E9PRP9_ANGAN
MVSFVKYVHEHTSNVLEFCIKYFNCPENCYWFTVSFRIGSRKLVYQSSRELATAVLLICGLITSCSYDSLWIPDLFSKRKPS